MEIRLLRYFVAVAEAQNLQDAAERLGIAKPPLSRAIRNLEIDVGTELFSRRSRRMDLTEAGAHLLKDARLILDLTDRAAAATRELGKRKRRRLRIGIVGSPTSRSVERYLDTLRRSTPDDDVQTFELPSGLQARMLIDRKLDAGILFPPLDANGLASHVLWREPFVLLLPLAHPLASKNAIGLDDLQDQPLILPHPEFGSGAYYQIMQAFEDAGIRPTIGQYALTREAVVALVSLGYGLGWVPSSLSLAGQPGVTVRPFAEPRPHLTLSVAVRDEPESLNLMKSLIQTSRVARL
ncbi:MAG: LysR family transcriptional regulator [Pseudomonadota bacterium]